MSTDVDEYFGQKAGIVWATLKNGPLNAAAIKRKTKLSDAEIYGALGWLARESKLSIDGSVPLLFRFKLKE